MEKNHRDVKQNCRWNPFVVWFPAQWSLWPSACLPPGAGNPSVDPELKIGISRLGLTSWNGSMDIPSGNLTELWTITIFSCEISHEAWWFSIIFFNYQRVSCTLWNLCLNMEIMEDLPSRGWGKLVTFEMMVAEIHQPMAEWFSVNS